MILADDELGVASFEASSTLARSTGGSYSVAAYFAGLENVREVSKRARHPASPPPFSGTYLARDTRLSLGKRVVLLNVLASSASSSGGGRHRSRVGDGMECVLRESTSQGRVCWKMLQQADGERALLRKKFSRERERYKQQNKLTRRQHIRLGQGNARALTERKSVSVRSVSAPSSHRR